MRWNTESPVCLDCDRCTYACVCSAGAFLRQCDPTEHPIVFEDPMETAGAISFAEDVVSSGPFGPVPDAALVREEFTIQHGVRIFVWHLPPGMWDKKIIRMVTVERTYVPQPSGPSRGWRLILVDEDEKCYKQDMEPLASKADGIRYLLKWKS